MTNRIYLGGADGQPRTLTTTFLGTSGTGLDDWWTPGVAVVIDSNQNCVLRATSATKGRIGLVGDADFWDESRGWGSWRYGAHSGGMLSMVDPTRTDLGTTGRHTIYLPRPGEQYQWQVIAGAYSAGQELTIGAGGRLKAAVSGDTVVATLDLDMTGPLMGFLDGVLAPVMIVPFHKRY